MWNYCETQDVENAWCYGTSINWNKMLLNNVLKPKQHFFLDSVEKHLLQQKSWTSKQNHNRIHILVVTNVCKKLSQSQLYIHVQVFLNTNSPEMQIFKAVLFFTV